MSLTTTGKTLNRFVLALTSGGGLETPSQALDKLGIDHQLEFYCEKELHLRHFVAASFRPNYIIADVLDRDSKVMPYCDLFCWGSPCQPFSKLGLQLGLEDLKRRGILLFGSIDYIKEKRPKVLLAENVLNLIQKFKAEFQRLVQILQDLGYKIYWDTVNSYDNNLHQSRNRVYLVGFHTTVQPSLKKRPFVFLPSWTTGFPCNNARRNM